MTSKLNHHFVPKYLFRLFSSGENYIHLVLKASSRAVFRASIRHQCSRHKFYGTDEVEDYLAILDARHVAALRAAIRECWSGAQGGFTDDEFYWLFEALMLQRARTPRAAQSLAHNAEQLAIQAFREYVVASPDDGTRDRIVEAIDKNQVTIKEPIIRPLLNSLVLGLRSVIGITDLNLALLRNSTPAPFIFGDSPCVFYNRYLHGIPHVGGLGVQSPGLMILMPLDQDTQVMLYDPDTYRLTSTYLAVDLTEVSDVAQLNALQIHSADTSIYFVDWDDADSIVAMVNAHRPLFKQSNNEFIRWPRGGILIDGKPAEGEVMQMFESQLPLQVDLSFVETRPMPRDENPRRARSPELRRELMERLDADEEAVDSELAAPPSNPSDDRPS